MVNTSAKSVFCFDLYALQFLPEPVTSTITAETIVCLNTDAANATYGYHEGEGGGGGGEGCALICYKNIPVGEGGAQDFPGECGGCHL